nr:M28 family peptidase [Paenibacillus sp. GSMTC-2017]
MYTSLSENSPAIKELKLQIDRKEERIEASNVIGTISATAETKRQAIVIAAHFDAAGWDKKVAFSNGALNNATGVSVMLELAKKLHQRSVINSIPADIIFAAFNGSETGHQGSEDFAKEIKSAYEHIYTINLDTIGGKMRGQTVITANSPATLLADSIRNVFKDYKLSVIDNMSTLTGDHSSFLKHHLLGVTITDVMDSIPQSSEEIQKIDYDHLDQIVNALLQLVTDASYLPNHFTINESLPENKWAFEPSMDEFFIFLEDSEKRTDQLELGQYVTYNAADTGQPYTVHKTDDTFNSSDELENKINGMKVTPNVEDYSFDTATVIIQNFSDQFIKDPILDKIYTLKKAEIKDIVAVELVYTNEQGTGIRLHITPLPADNNLENHHNYGQAFHTEKVIANDRTYHLTYLNKIDKSLTTSFNISVDGSKYLVDYNEVQQVNVKDQKRFINLSKLSEKETLLKRINLLPLPQIIQDLGI